jgi:hypothetical protein
MLHLPLTLRFCLPIRAFFTSSTLNVVKEALNLSKEVEIITTALDNLRSLVSKLTGNHLREFVDLLDTNAVTGVIERLKTHEDDNIYLRAVHLLNEYPNMRFPNLLPQADIMVRRSSVPKSLCSTNKFLKILLCAWICRGHRNPFWSKMIVPNSYFDLASRKNHVQQYHNVFVE